MAKPNFTQEELCAEMHYDASTGIFTRLKYRGVPKTVPASLKIDKDGYAVLKFRGASFLAHRLAWFYVHGFWPKEYIDHKNGDPADNRLCNLRESTNSENQQNLKARRENTAGKLLGTAWHKRKRKWIARIGIGRERIFLGYYPTAEEAHEAYLSAKTDIHPFQPTPRHDPY